MVKTKSIAEKIAELSNPGLTFHPDLEETLLDSAARVEDYSVENTVVRGRTGLKQSRIPQAFTSEDVRYSGKKVSRKELVSEEEFDSDLDQSALSDFQTKLKVKSASNGDSSSENESDGDSNQEDEDEELKASSENSEVEEEDGSVEDEEEGMEESDGDNDEDFGDDENFTAVAKSEGVSEAEKGRAVRTQFGIYDQLIESRIKLQKSLISTNKLPQFSSWDDFVGSFDSEAKTTLKKAQGSLKDLLDTLLDLQGHLFMQNPKTSSVVAKGGSAPKDEGSDEEIPSDSEEEQAPEAEYEPLKKRLKLHEYANTAQERHKKFLGFRNETIQYWNQKTKLASGKLSSKSFQKFEQSTLKQIELILADRERLVKRTQIKRSAYLPIGGQEIQKPLKEVNDMNEPELKKNDDFEYDPEIFDDDDFYHQVLRELIERKTSDSSDAAVLGRQLLEIQKLRSKGKRKVDTKASKGRRIRYDVHQKLVNFMPPITQGTMYEDVTTDLFNSLFGKRVKGAGG